VPQPVPGQAATMWDPTRTLRTSDRAASRDVRRIGRAQPRRRWRPLTP